MELDLTVVGPLVQPHLPQSVFVHQAASSLSLPSDDTSRCRRCESLPFASIRLGRDLHPQTPGVPGTPTCFCPAGAGLVACKVMPQCHGTTPVRTFEKRQSGVLVLIVKLFRFCRQSLNPQPCLAQQQITKPLGNFHSASRIQMQKLLSPNECSCDQALTLFPQGPPAVQSSIENRQSIRPISRPANARSRRCRGRRRGRAFPGRGRSRPASGSR